MEKDFFDDELSENEQESSVKFTVSELVVILESLGTYLNLNDEEKRNILDFRIISLLSFILSLLNFVILFAFLLSLDI